MLFGFVNTATLHLAKGLQRHGIETLRWRTLSRRDRSPGRAVIYVIGVILNNLAAIWIILANRFAAPAYATGMFGLGLVVLLLYSHFVLDEPVAPVNYLGCVFVVLGTALFGADALQNGRIDASRLEPWTVAIFAGAYILVAALFVVFVVKSRRGVLLSLAFGMLTGGMGSLDPVLKALGQNAGGVASVVPLVGWGWIPFGLSFLLGTGAFFNVQYAFLKGADASAMVPVQTSVYVLVPVAVQLVALPGYDLTLLLSLGIVMILSGIVLTQTGRRVPPPAVATATPIPGAEEAPGRIAAVSRKEIS
jgi:hypothetical protein